MTHPTCAPARPPDPSPTSASALPSEADRAALSRQAHAELEAMRKAYHCLTCIDNLLLHARDVRKEDRYFSIADVQTLIDLVSTEFDRRSKAAKATATALLALSGMTVR